MSKWSKEADWNTFLKETIKTGALPGNKFAEKCGIPFGAWLEMANKANRMGNVAIVKWATESLAKIQKPGSTWLSDQKDRELANSYTIITNLGWSGNAYYIVNGESAQEVLQWGEKALTFFNHKDAERFAAEVFAGENGENRIELIKDWENPVGHIVADNLSYQDGHLKEKVQSPAAYAKNIKWDADGVDMEETVLPERICIPEDIAKEGDEAISDYITQETGFCHKGYELETVQKKKRHKTR